MNEYLNKLRKILEKNHYEDVDNTMEYYEELFADKREAGESDEDILREMDDVEKVAEEILGKRLIDIEEDDNKKGIIRAMDISLFSCDLVVNTGNTDEVLVDAPDDENLIVETVGDKLVIKEKNHTNQIFQHLTNDYLIHIELPVETILDEVNMSIASSDLSIDGNMFIYKMYVKSASADISINQVEMDELNIKIASGDISIRDNSVERLVIQSASGDIYLKNVIGASCAISNVSGDIKTQSIDYSNIECKTTSGDISVCLNGDDEMYTIYKNAKVIGNGANIVKLKSLSGDIDIDFCD
mgnify:FL=1